MSDDNRQHGPTGGRQGGARTMKAIFAVVAVAIYAAILIAISAGMFRARSRALSADNYDEAKEDWKEWVEETERQSAGEGPVTRRKVEREEPPTVVLMRDHFHVCLAAALVLTSCVYATLVLLLWGAIFSAGTARPAEDTARSNPSAGSIR